mgnify:CR=1 FL=1
MGEAERGFERLLESKEMYERLMGFVGRVFKKRTRMREGVTQ